MELELKSFLFTFFFFLVCESRRTQSGFYADNGLQQTVILDKIPQRQRKEIKHEILSLLGLHHRPRPVSHVRQNSAPKYMLELYNTLQIQNEEEVEEESRKGDKRPDHGPGLMNLNITQEGAERQVGAADMIMSFVNHAHDEHRRPDEPRHLYFDFSEVPATEMITTAQLRLYKVPVYGLSHHEPFTIEVFRVKKAADPEERILTAECNATTVTSYDGWIDLNVTGAALEWSLYPATNLGLYLRVSNPQGYNVDPRDLGIIDKHGPEDRQAFMVAFFRTAQKVHVRKPRSARKMKRHKEDIALADQADYKYGYSPVRYSRRSCQRRTLFVDFKDLGWQDWIIAPEGYAAFFCQGECSFPLNAHMNATNHAIVQTLVHLMNPYGAPKPCCAPTKLAAISVLYFDDNSNVILKKYRNMVVRACGCH